MTDPSVSPNSPAETNPENEEGEDVGSITFIDGSGSPTIEFFESSAPSYELSIRSSPQNSVNCEYHGRQYKFSMYGVGDEHNGIEPFSVDIGCSKCVATILKTLVLQRRGFED